MTIAVPVELFPDASLHVTVSVYTLPLPVPERSARRFAVRSPVICQSGLVSPSPNPFTGSLLLTLVIRQATELHRSDATTATFTPTI